MRLFKIQILIIFLALPLVSCIDDIAPEKTEQEIISEISKTWSCDMIEDSSFTLLFDVVISSDANNDATIHISNFHNGNETITATVGRDLIISFDYEADNQIFKGFGEISNDYSRISWEYTVENSDVTVNVTGTSTYGGEA